MLLKSTETSKKNHFFERIKIKLQRNYINQCIVIENYRNFVIKHQQYNVSYKQLIHCITCYKFFTLHQFL